MSIMAKTPSGYKKIGSAYLGERPVDKVFNANGDVVYALQRELTGVPPLLFKGKEQSELLNYRIYGDTVDGESVGDRTGNLFDYSSGITYSHSTLGNINLWAYGPQSTGTVLRIPCSPNTIYTLSISENIVHSTFRIANINSDDVPISGQDGSFSCTMLVNDGSLSTATFTTTELAKYILFQIDTRVIMDAVQTLMLNAGSTALPYEPYGYKVPVTVEGKNLFSSRIEQGSFDGTTGAPNNSSTRVRSHEDDYVFLTPGAYKISAMGVEHFVVYAYDLPDASAFNNNLSRTNWAPLSSTITINTSAYYKFGFCKTNNPIITPSDISNIMLNTGSTALPYEPYHTPVTTPIYLPEPIKMIGDEVEYIDYAEQKQHRVRKNLLQNTTTSRTINGVTFTVNSDGSVTCNGEATAVAMLEITNNWQTNIILGNRYIGSGCPPGGSDATYYLDLHNFGHDTGDSVITRASHTEGGSYKAQIVIRTGYTCDNLTFYPMIRKADIEDDTYEPYIENTELDVTLPALPIIKGTNTMSIDTTVQPSRIDIKGRIKSLT